MGEFLGNPQGNTQPATVTRLYDDPMLIYENDTQYQQRLRAAMFKSAEFIFQHVGFRPRVMVWPYGQV
jgi:biofilm PGA synthesis lipoprotein PgaB